MFQFSGLALLHLCIQCRVTGLQPAGFPHSEIHGSKLVCSSPWLIAAYHVLLRQSMPRHPPYALIYLNSHHFTWYELMPYLLSTPTEAGIPMTLSRTRYTHNAFLRYGTNITSKNNRLSTKRPVVRPVVHPGLCGVTRIRTEDPLLAKQVLYQLSYNPA